MHLYNQCLQWYVQTYFSINMPTSWLWPFVRTTTSNRHCNNNFFVARGWTKQFLSHWWMVHIILSCNTQKPRALPFIYCDYFQTVIEDAGIGWSYLHQVQSRTHFTEIYIIDMYLVKNEPNTQSPPGLPPSGLGQHVAPKHYTHLSTLLLGLLSMH